MSDSPRFQSDDIDPAPLGKPLHFEFSNRSAPNRFLKGAMTERLSTWDPKKPEVRGVPSEELVNLYRRWGEGGSGLILTGNVMMEYDQLEHAGNAIVPPGAPHSGERFDRFKAMATEGRRHGSLMVAQVSHPGRQVEDAICANPISASDVQLQGEFLGSAFAKPRPATKAEIASIVERFVTVAEYLDAAGYDGIQLHGAHGYLLAQFLSPTTNKRTDEYGGSIENRARIIVEIAQEIRKRLRPDFILGIKMNSVEFQAEGFTADEALEVAQILERNQFDFIELSGGTYQKMAFEHQRESTRKREAFFIEFAEKIVPAIKQTKTYVTGGFKTAGGMVRALDTVDGVGIGRAVTQEPRLPKDILEGRVKGAIEQKIDLNDFGLTVTGAGAHMMQIARDHEPLDLGKQDNADAFVKDWNAWVKSMSNDPEHKLFHFADITSVKPTPYGQHA